MKKAVFLVFSLLIALTFTSDLQGQTSIKDSLISFSKLNFNGTFQAPFGDMEERFGSSVTIGGGYEYKHKSNWLFGAYAGYLFGGDVNDTVAQDIRNDDGLILDNQGNFVDLLVQERGFMAQAHIGKIFPVIGPNDNSGLLAKLGVGLLQHQIWLETRNNEVNILEGEYRKGYDKLTNGLMLTQYIGYVHHSNNKRVNYSIGLEFAEAFTESRRDFNFDLGRRDDTQRTDILVGLKLGWSFLLYRAASDRVYYN